MDTLRLDIFTQDISRLYASARATNDPLRVLSYIGHARRLEGKRDRLSRSLFQVPYSQAVAQGKYEPWT